jgi:hypothetical protein
LAHLAGQKFLANASFNQLSQHIPGVPILAEGHTGYFFGLALLFLFLGSFGLAFLNSVF